MNASAAKKAMFKEGYEGPQPRIRLTLEERAGFEERTETFVRRLHNAMLVLSCLDDEDLGGHGSSMPSYIHDWGDKLAQAENEAPPVRKPFDPRPYLGDFLPTMALLDGLRPIFHRVLFLRAIGEYHGGWSWDEIGERYGKSGEWARTSHQAVVVQAARRAGLLASAPHLWAILVAATRHGGWCCYLTTAQDPAHQLRDLRSKNLLPIEEAFCLWTPGQPVAKRVVKAARKEHLAGVAQRGSWHVLTPDELADKLIHELRLVGATWEMETLSTGTPRSRPLTLLSDTHRKLDGENEG